MNERAALRRHLRTFEKLVETQRKRFEAAEKILALTQAAVAESKKTPKTAKQLRELDNAINNSLKIARDTFEGLQGLQGDLQMLRKQLSSLAD